MSALECGHDLLSLMDVPPEKPSGRWRVICGACAEEAMDRAAGLPAPTDPKEGAS